MVSGSEVLSYAQLVVYIPVCLLNQYIVVHHRFHKQVGWIFLASMAVTRIAGSVLGILAAKHPDSISYAEWSAILSSVGLSPLLMASLFLLKRVIDLSAVHFKRQRNYRLFPCFGKYGKYLTLGIGDASTKRGLAIQLLHIPAMVGAGLSTIGGTDLASSNASDRSSGISHMKIGTIIFLLVYLNLVLLALLTSLDFGHILRGEKRVVIAVILALPFLGVRFLYGILDVFVNKGAFKFFGGSVIVRALMATLMEAIVVIMYTTVGLSLPKNEKTEDREVAMEGYRSMEGQRLVAEQYRGA